MIAIKYSEKIDGNCSCTRV